jgi:hypothetical protein
MKKAARGPLFCYWDQCLFAEYRHHIVRPGRTEGLLLEDVQLVAHLRRLI